MGLKGILHTSEHCKAISAALLKKYNIKHYNETEEKRCCRCKQYQHANEFAKGEPMCRSCKRNASYIRKYGITSEQYKTKLIEQNNKCDCCGEKLQIVENLRRGDSNKVSLDHDHVTGKVRGIVCQRCNLAIIVFDNNVLLSNVISYMEKHK